MVSARSSVWIACYDPADLSALRLSLSLSSLSLLSASLVALSLELLGESLEASLVMAEKVEVEHPMGEGWFGLLTG